MMHGSHAVKEAVSTKWLLFLAVFVVTLFFQVSANAVTVSSQPSSVTVNEGQPVTFKIVASSTNGSTIRYTWYRNNVVITGATSSTYAITSTKTSDAGTFRCVVKDSASTYKCRSFSLKVTASTLPVSITQQPSNAMVNEGSSTSMSVTASGSGTLTYQWYFNGQAITGATSSMLSFASASLANAGNYYAVVRNASSSATSTTATLSVLSIPKTWSARLIWTQPTVREDGSALASSDIASYLVYYASSSTGSMTLLGSTSASTLNYLVSSLASGTHYFAVRTRDLAGMESAFSTRQSLTF